MTTRYLTVGDYFECCDQEVDGGHQTELPDLPSVWTALLAPATRVGRFAAYPSFTAKVVVMTLALIAAAGETGSSDGATLRAIQRFCTQNDVLWQATLGEAQEFRRLARAVRSGALTGRQLETWLFRRMLFSEGGSVT